MSKVLEALEKVRKCRYPFARDNQEAFDVIEKELKEKELQDLVINEIKDLFAFGSLDTKVEPQDNGDISIIPKLVYRITREIDNKKKEIIRDFILKQCFPKELKALEIIKEKGINVDYFKRHCDIEYDDEFNIYRIEEILTQEEYGLLKEVLL